MVGPSYDLEFYEDENGDMPVLRWIREELTPQKRRALGTAMNEILQHLGPNIVAGNFGDTLGGGLFEFRLDQDVHQILARVGKKAKTKDTRGGKILSRVFCHAHGNKIILLLGAYDKGKSLSASRQQSEIARARKRLDNWNERRKRERNQP